VQFVELFDSSAFSHDLLEAAPDPVVVVDKRGRIVLVNSQTSRVFGFDHAELIDQTVEILMPERLRHAHERYRASYSERPEVRRMGEPMGVLLGKRKDGTEFPVEISLSPFHGPEGLFIISIIRDVSHRVEFEQRLRHMNTHDSLTGVYNRAFFDEEMARLGKGRSPVGIVVVDIDGLKEVNDRFGHDSGDSLIKSAAALVSEAFRAEDSRGSGSRLLAVYYVFAYSQLEVYVKSIVEDSLSTLNTSPPAFDKWPDLMLGYILHKSERLGDDYRRFNFDGDEGIILAKNAQAARKIAA